MKCQEEVLSVRPRQGERPEVTYADRAGKYQGQRGVTLPKL